MSSGKPPLLPHIEELKKEIKDLRGDITEIKLLLVKYQQDLNPVLVEKPEIPFLQKSQSEQAVEKGWFF